MIYILDLNTEYHHIHLGLALYIKYTFLYMMVIGELILNEDKFLMIVKWNEFHVLFYTYGYSCVEINYIRL